MNKYLRTALRPSRALAWALLSLLAPAFPSNATGNQMQLYVDPSGPANGDGSKQNPFNDIAAAVSAGRLQAGNNSAVKINLAAGHYDLSQPLVLDYALTLQGANVAIFDKDGRPTGAVDPAAGETTISAALNANVNPLIRVLPRAGQSTVENVTMANLTLLDVPVTNAAAATLSVRNAQGAVLTGLIVQGANSASGIDFIASSGAIRKTYVTGSSACGICVSGGPADSPAKVTVTDNRSVANTAGALLLAGTTSPQANVGESLTATVANNDLSGNVTPRLGFGIRIFVVNRATGIVPDTGTVVGQVTANIDGNTIAGNRYALMLDAGFARRNVPLSSPAVCADQRTFGGMLDVRLGMKNDIRASLIAPAVITTTRAQVLVNSAANPPADWQYLHGATITISDPKQTLMAEGASFVVHNPATDPFSNDSGLGSCSNDSAHEPLHNTVLYNNVGL